MAKGGSRSKKSSGGGGSTAEQPAAATASSALDPDKALGSVPLKKIEAIADDFELNVGKSPIKSDDEADFVSAELGLDRYMLTEQFEANNAFDAQGKEINTWGSALDRMDWSPTYNNPSKNLMKDAIGSGFVITLQDLDRLKNNAYRAVPKEYHPTLDRFVAVGQYKLNKLWSNASKEAKAEAISAMGSMGFSINKLKTLGLDYKP